MVDMVVRYQVYDYASTITQFRPRDRIKPPGLIDPRSGRRVEFVNAAGRDERTRG